MAAGQCLVRACCGRLHREWRNFAGLSNGAGASFGAFVDTDVDCICLKRGHGGTSLPSMGTRFFPHPALGICNIFFFCGLGLSLLLDWRKRRAGVDRSELRNFVAEVGLNLRLNSRKVLW